MIGEKKGMAQSSTLRVNLTRLHKRVTVNTAVEVRRFGQQNWRNRGSCTDLSEGGLGIKLDLVLQVGEVVEVRFPTGEDEIVYRARVIYRRNNSHYGIKFLEIAESSTSVHPVQPTVAPQ
jgi:hypothetical protein